jgi:hypothetical protein
MSVVSCPDRTAEQALEEFLHDQVENGVQFFKARSVAEVVEFSSHELGAAFRNLKKSDNTLQIQKWANSRGTTWRVEKISTAETE